MLPWLVLLGVAAVVVFWGIGIYNRLIALRNDTLNNWKQIDVQLKRRHDLIPNLVNTVKGAMEFEQSTLTMVVEARNRAAAATGPADAAAKEGALTQALGKLFALAESYPALKANENVKLLQDELAGTENKIGAARSVYNDVATRFNTAQQQFPSSLVASSFGFSPSELFEVAVASEREVPTVDLSLKK